LGSVSSAAAAASSPTVSGCAVSRSGQCKCYDTRGGQVDMQVSVCKDLNELRPKVVVPDRELGAAVVLNDPDARAEPYKFVGP
jgi:hypothetical protein